MKRLFTFICLYVCLAVQPGLSDTFLDGRISYTPPRDMHSFDDDSAKIASGVRDGLLKFYSDTLTSEKTLYRVIFLLESVGVEMGADKAPVYTSIVREDLKRVIEGKYKRDPSLLGKLTFVPTEVSGRKGYIVTFDMARHSSVRDSVCMHELWLLLEPNRILIVAALSTDPKSFRRAVKSLKSLKITTQKVQP